MSDQPRQITITLDAGALAALERYQQARRAWLESSQSPEVGELSDSVTTAARSLAMTIDEAATWPPKSMKLKVIEDYGIGIAAFVLGGLFSITALLKQGGVI
ncbi:TPA: hypothetical protein ACKRQV_000085 [Pseudomonas aeruginosa]|nr:hypothetical protein [Pseudomonas aeruginosa]EIU2864558.1 hypothetical protein [Pseudomonas aeruginosa]HEK3716894.1 hypothetical protein [Pseudomonas aeruginosa]